MKIVVVSLLDRLIITTTTTHNNQTNQKFGQKLMSLALMLEAKSLGPLLGHFMGSKALPESA